MAWVAVDEDGGENIFEEKPTRGRGGWWEEVFPRKDILNCIVISLPKGSIKKLIGRDLSWQDGPVEL